MDLDHSLRRNSHLERSVRIWRPLRDCFSYKFAFQDPHRTPLDICLPLNEVMAAPSRLAATALSMSTPALTAIILIAAAYVWHRYAKGVY